jgi:hypothetical protein
MSFNFRNLTFMASSLWCLAAVANADTQAKVYPIAGVTQLIVAGDTQVELVQDGSEYLRIDAEAEVLSRVSVDQSGNKLTIKVRYGDNWFNWFSHDSLHIRVTLRLKELNYLEMSGAARLQSAALNGSELRVDASGASDLTLGSFNYAAVGLDLSGASNLKLQELHVQTLKADISGASNVDVETSGRVEQLYVQASGASNFRAQALQAQAAKLDASGASSIAVAVTNSLQAKASGASAIDYYGELKADSHTSGASSINQHTAN